MAYKEKIAWLYLIGMVTCFGAYFLFLIFNPSFYSWKFLHQFIPLAICGTINGFFAGIGHFILMRAHDASDRLSNDERDVAIESKSTIRAYHVLIYAVLFVGGYLPFFAEKWVIVNCAILAVCIAEVTRNCSIIISYRQQKS